MGEDTTATTTANESPKEETKPKPTPEMNQRMGVVLKAEGNDVCADCPATRPLWVSFLAGRVEKERKMGILCCTKCAQYHHFELGSKRCLIKYLKMAHEFSMADIVILEGSGNIKVNHIFEAKLTKEDFDKDLVLKDDAEEATRRSKFIKNKYKKCKYQDEVAYYQRMLELTVETVEPTTKEQEPEPENEPEKEVNRSSLRSEMRKGLSHREARKNKPSKRLTLMKSHSYNGRNSKSGGEVKTWERMKQAQLRRTQSGDATETRSIASRAERSTSRDKDRSTSRDKDRSKSTGKDKDRRALARAHSSFALVGDRKNRRGDFSRAKSSTGLGRESDLRSSDPAGGRHHHRGKSSDRGDKDRRGAIRGSAPEQFSRKAIMGDKDSKNKETDTPVSGADKDRRGAIRSSSPELFSGEEVLGDKHKHSSADKDRRGAIRGSVPEQFSRKAIMGEKGSADKDRRGAMRVAAPQQFSGKDILGSRSSADKSPERVLSQDRRRDMRRSNSMGFNQLSKGGSFRNSSSKFKRSSSFGNSMNGFGEKKKRSNSLGKNNSNETSSLHRRGSFRNLDGEPRGGSLHRRSISRTNSVDSVGSKHKRGSSKEKEASPSTEKPRSRRSSSMGLGYSDTGTPNSGSLTKKLARSRSLDLRSGGEQQEDSKTITSNEDRRQKLQKSRSIRHSKKKLISKGSPEGKDKASGSPDEKASSKTEVGSPNGAHNADQPQMQRSRTSGDATERRRHVRKNRSCSPSRRAGTSSRSGSPRRGGRKQLSSRALNLKSPAESAELKTAGEQPRDVSPERDADGDRGIDWQRDGKPPNASDAFFSSQNTKPLNEDVQNLLDESDISNNSIWKEIEGKEKQTNQRRSPHDSAPLLGLRNSATTADDEEKKEAKKAPRTLPRRRQNRSFHDSAPIPSLDEMGIGGSDHKQSLGDFFSKGDSTSKSPRSKKKTLDALGGQGRSFRNRKKPDMHASAPRLDLGKSASRSRRMLSGNRSRRGLTRCLSAESLMVEPKDKDETKENTGTKLDKLDLLTSKTKTAPERAPEGGRRKGLVRALSADSILVDADAIKKSDENKPSRAKRSQSPARSPRRGRAGGRQLARCLSSDNQMVEPKEAQSEGKTLLGDVDVNKANTVKPNHVVTSTA